MLRKKPSEKFIFDRPQNSHVTSTRQFACNCMNVNFSRSYVPLCVHHWISCSHREKIKIWNNWKSMKCIAQHGDKAL